MNNKTYCPFKQGLSDCLRESCELWYAVENSCCFRALGNIMNYWKAEISLIRSAHEKKGE